MPTISQPRIRFLLSLLPALTAACLLICAPAGNAQSSSNSGSPTTSTAAPPANPQAPPADSSAKPAAPAKPKHVLTNDDLESHSAPAHSGDAQTIPGEENLILRCEASCEQEARSQLGYDSDNEAEWRVQIVKARRDLIEDSTWRGMLSQAIQQAATYCNFAAQASQQTAPSGDDYRSRVQRAKNNQYFENMDRVLRQGMQTTLNRMQDHVKEVQVLSPVRAAMMTVQAARIFERDCDSHGTQ